MNSNENTAHTPDVDTLYQRVRRRVEKIKVEDFFRNGAHDDYFELKIIKKLSTKKEKLR